MADPDRLSQILFTLVCQIQSDSISSRQILLIFCQALSGHVRPYQILSNDPVRSFLIFPVSFRSLLIPASIFYPFLSKLSTSNLTHWKTSLITDFKIIQSCLITSPSVDSFELVSIFILSKQIWENGGGIIPFHCIPKVVPGTIVCDFKKLIFTVCRELFVAKSHWCGLFPLAPL